MKDINGKIQYRGKDYALVFNLNVMENVQAEYGTVEKWGDLTDGSSGEVDAKALIFGFTEMLNEGIDIANEENGTDDPHLTHKHHRGRSPERSKGHEQHCDRVHTFSGKKLIIHDDADPVIDFSWFYFIGKTKLNMSFKETGRMTITLFNRLWKHWKDEWSVEMRLTHANMTFEEAQLKSIQDEEWF